jgi:UDP-N-acetylglucosamine:LPS N-acetylglucosamine transferase
MRCVCLLDGEIRLPGKRLSKQPRRVAKYSQTNKEAISHDSLLSQAMPGLRCNLPKAPNVDFVYFEAGGGHRSAALALQSVIASEGYGWNVRLINLQEILDPLDVFRKVVRIRLQDIYNLLLAKGWTLGSRYLLRMMQFIIRIYHPQQVTLLKGFWAEQRPDLVVSLVPNLNRALFESLQRALPGTPFVTVLTDLADYPPHFWIEKQPQYFICGTEHAFAQALQCGHPPNRVFRASGMILRPEFYKPSAEEREAIRARLGLAPDIPTGLVLFGGEGSNVMYSIASRLGNAGARIQLIMVCGRNAVLKARIDRLQTRNKIHAEGFTKEIPALMSASDFFIGKPGPGSVSEALHMRLPVIVEKNAWTLPQERFNAEWIRQHGFGIVLSSFRHIESAVTELLSDDHLARMRAAAGRLHNRAVFEVPEILQRILAASEKQSGI